MKHNYFLAVAVALSIFTSSVSPAESIKFPEEELAKESVHPVFDRLVAVKNRRVVTQGRGEIAGFFGISLNEPFYSSTLFGVQGTYHLTEEHGVNLVYNGWTPEVSSYAQKLQEEFSYRFDAVPKPEHLLLANYQYTMYYGKMSLTKNLVVNLSLYGLGGGGVMSFSGDILPALTAGLGQKFYLTPNMALRFDLRVVSFQGPNLVSRELHNIPAQTDTAYFEQKLFFYSLLTSGISYMF